MKQCFKEGKKNTRKFDFQSADDYLEIGYKFPQDCTCPSSLILVVFHPFMWVGFPIPPVGITKLYPSQLLSHGGKMEINQHGVQQSVLWFKSKSDYAQRCFILTLQFLNSFLIYGRSQRLAIKVGLAPYFKTWLLLSRS